MSAVQSIIADPNQLLSVSYFDLGYQLRASSQQVLSLFVTSVTNAEWFASLTCEQRALSKKKLSLSLPSHTPRLCLNIFQRTYRGQGSPRLSDSFPIHLWTFNKELVLKYLQNDFFERVGREAEHHSELYLLALYQEYRHSGTAVSLKVILDQGVSLSKTFKSKSLLSIVAQYGSAQDLQLTLDYCRRRLGENYKEYLGWKLTMLFNHLLTEPDKVLVLIRACRQAGIDPGVWIKQIDWIGNPESFLMVMGHLDEQRVQEFYRAHGLTLVLLAAMEGQDVLEEWMERMQAANMDPRQFFPPRQGKKLSPIEELLLMLGKRETCLLIKEVFGGPEAEEITVPQSDDFYKEYFDRSVLTNLQNLNRELKKGMEIASDKEGKKNYLEETRNIWNNEAYLFLIDKFLRAALTDATFLLRDAHEKCAGGVEGMQLLLNSLLEEGPHYTHRFFYDSFVEVYHLARAQCCRIPSFYVLPKLEREDEEAFFTPGHTKYFWRQMYNTLEFALSYYSLEKLRQAYYDYTLPDIDRYVDENNEGRVRFPTNRPLIFN